MIFARHAFLGHEVASEHHLEAVDRDEAGRAEPRLHLIGALAGLGEADAASGPRVQPFERVAAALPFLVGAGRAAVAVVLHPGPDDHDAIAVLVGQRRQQRGVDDREDRRVRGDSERQREQGDDRESWGPPEQTDPEPRVSEEVHGGPKGTSHATASCSEIPGNRVMTAICRACARSAHVRNRPLFVRFR
jgi:hypothetical protein